MYSCSKSKVFSFGSIVAVGIIAIAAWQIHTQLAYAKPVGTLITEPNSTLQAHINTFMETEGTDTDFWFEGRENYHCSTVLYGYDEQYAYTWRFCAGYSGSDPETITMATAGANPARFTYTQPDFKVTAVKETQDGTLYEPSLRKIFPKAMYQAVHNDVTSAQGTDLEADVRAKAVAQLTGDEYVSVPLQGNEYTSAEVDLNNDGVKEAIVLTLGRRTTPSTEGTPTALSVNGRNVIVPSDVPQGYFGIVDIDTADGLKEIAVSDLGPSTDYTTSLYMFDGTSLKLMGTIEGLYERMRFDGKGNLTTITRAAMLDTWFYEDIFTLADDHKLVHVPQDFYERVSKLGGPMLATLSFQVSPTDSTIAMTLEKGEGETIVGCDNVSWCKVVSDDGTEGWFSIDDDGHVEGTSLFPSEVFDGLSNAD